MYNTVGMFLKVFDTATNDCLSAKYPTTQFVVTHIYHIANNFKEHRKNTIFKDACTLMESKFSDTLFSSLI